MSTAETRRVYVWELPVRFYHWINVASVAVLAVTGYLIGNPPAIQSAAEASGSYLFGTIRFLHFVAAFVFFFNFLFRLYWGFVGNGREPGTVTLTRPQFLSDYPRSLGAHDVGLRDLIEAASLLGSLPAISLMTVSIAEVRPATMDLSPPVQAALAEVAERLRGLLRPEGFPACQGRSGGCGETR